MKSPVVGTFIASDSSAKSATKGPAKTVARPRRWILLRGLARHQIHWGDFPMVLKDAFPDDEFLTIDTNGNGSRADRRAFLRIEDSVADLRERTTEFRKGQPVMLLTISLGAMLGLCWAEKFPSEVQGVTCINTSDARLSPFFDRMRPKAFVHLLRTMLLPMSNQSRELALFKITAPSSLQKRELFNNYADRFAQHPMTTFGQSLRQLISAARFQLPARAPAVPLLLMAGLGDQLVNPLCTKKIEEAWSAPARYHAWAGHDIPIEDPNWICSQLVQWVPTI